MDWSDLSNYNLTWCHLTRLRLGLSHLRKHKLKHGFQDMINPLCSCGNDVESTEHFSPPLSPICP